MMNKIFDNLNIKTCPNHYITKINIDSQGDICVIGNDENFKSCPKCRHSIQIIVNEMINELKTKYV